MRKNIPESTLASLERYATKGIPTGGFLRKVLSNDLFGAMGAADLENQKAMFDICQYIYNEMPGICWGSPERVDAWLKKENW